VNAIEVEDLVKRYGALTAVDHITFQVGRQEIFGFLGPNGAGKTTTIRMLATLTEPTAGKARVGGHDVRTHRDEVRRKIGMVFQDTTLDDRLTAHENLLFHGLLYGLSAREVRLRAQPLLEMVGLGDRAQSLVRTFSGGMKRRLELVRGLLHAPEVLFLDEPTVGLDPQTREHVLSLSREQGVTIFMTTHYMEEAEYCHRIAIMDHGRIVALDTPAGLKAEIGEELLTLECDDEAFARRLSEDLAALGGTEWQGRTVRLAARDVASLLPQVAQRAGAHLARAEIHRPTLDDVFLHLTGREIREETVSPREAWRARWRGR
jgi:ABC-2 type transport system ATP-binding protein